LWTIHVDRRSMFRQEFRLGVLRGAERTLPPWLKCPGNDRNPNCAGNRDRMSFSGALTFGSREEASAANALRLMVEN
jgi:hypothetical protein